MAGASAAAAATGRIRIGVRDGGADQRVPIKNGNALRAALENRFDFWRRVDAFLKKHLATSDTQAALKP